MAVGSTHDKIATKIIKESKKMSKFATLDSLRKDEDEKGDGHNEYYSGGNDARGGQSRGIDPLDLCNCTAC